MLNLLQGNVYLADGIVSFISRLEVNGAVIIEEAQPLRAVQINLFDRGNLSNDVAFEITTLHTSYSFAMDFATRRRQTLANLADLVLIVPAEGYQATLPGAGWKTTGAKRDGLTSIINYAVRGGQFTVQSGGQGIPFGLPLLTEVAINPIIVQGGTIAQVPGGSLCVCRSIQVDGELDLSGELAVIGEN